MDSVDCEKIMKDMHECISENNNSELCKEVIETFEKVCKKKEEEKDKEAIQNEIVKLYLE